nr:hypothetical protein [uncultured Desulfobacter sp.]
MTSIIDYRSTYSFKDHYFLFISIFYSVTLAIFFDCWKKEFLFCFEQFFEGNFSYFVSVWSHPKFIPFFLSLCFMSYIIESWWASQIDSKHIVRFLKFFAGIVHPIILFLFLSTLCGEHFKNDIGLVNKAVYFNGMFLVSICYVLCLRAFFHGIKILLTCETLFRLIGILVTAFFLFFWLKLSDVFLKNHHEFIIYLNGALLFVGIVFFILKERGRNEFADNINADQFIDDIIPKAKMTERNSQDCGIVLIGLENTSMNLIKRKIIDEFRKDVEISISQNEFVQMFIPCVDKREKVKEKLERLKEKHPRINMVYDFRELHFTEYKNIKERQAKKNSLEETLRIIYNSLCEELRDQKV